MPLDHAGKFHMNPQVARMHSSKGVATVPEHADPGEQESENGHESIHHIELHPHGDGTHHSVTHFHEHHAEHTPEGTRTEHPDLEHFHQHVNQHVGNPGEEASEYDDAGDDGEGSDIDDEY